MKRRHRRTHHSVWTFLAVLLPLILVVAMAARRTGPLETAPIQLAPPK